VRKCLSRKDNQVKCDSARVLGSSRELTHACALQCSFFAYQGQQIMYRRYASLFFIVGCDDEVKFVGCAVFLRACLRAGAATHNPPAPLRYWWQIAVPRSRAMKRARVPLLAPTAMRMLILLGGWCPERAGDSGVHPLICGNTGSLFRERVRARCESSPSAALAGLQRSSSYHEVSP
jgi:hypothetical protein